MKKDIISTSSMTNNHSKSEISETAIIKAVSTYFDYTLPSKLSIEEKNIYNAVLKYFNLI